MHACTIGTRICWSRGSAPGAPASIASPSSRLAHDRAMASRSWSKTHKVEPWKSHVAWHDMCLQHMRAQPMHVKGFHERQSKAKAYAWFFSFSCNPAAVAGSDKSSSSTWTAILSSTQGFHVKLWNPILPVFLLFRICGSLRGFAGVLRVIAG